MTEPRPIFELPRTNRGVFFLSIPFILVASSLILTLDEESAGDLVNIVIPTAASVVVALCLVLLWLNWRTPFRTLGLVFLATFSVLAMGWISWTLYTELIGEVTGVIVSDLFWVTGYLMIILILAVVIVSIKIKVTWRMMAALAAYWAIIGALLWWVIAPTLSPSSPDFTENLVYGLYPLFDGILLSELTFLVWINRKGQLEDLWLFISTAVVFWTVGDVLFLAEENTGNYFVGSLPDVLYLCNYALLAVGFGLLVTTRARYTSIVPTAEVKTKGGAGTALEPMRTYIVYGSDSKAAYDLVAKNLRTGLEGLIVARRPPNAIRSEYGLQKTSIIWISTTPGIEVVHPSNLGILTDTIVRFLERSTDAIVFLDGFESLVAYNDFRRALQAVEHIKDASVTHNSRLVMSVDRRTLETKEVALLEKNSVVVSD